MEEASDILDPDLRLRTARGLGADTNSAFELGSTRLRDQTAEDIVDMVVEQAVEAYDEKEAEYPVMAGMYRFGTRVAGGHAKTRSRSPGRNGPASGFRSSCPIDDLKNKQREEIREVLVGHSRAASKRRMTCWPKLQAAVEQLFDEAASEDGTVPAGRCATVDLQSLSDWFMGQLRLRSRR